MLIDALAAGLEGSGYADGCPIATVALETAAGSEPLRATRGAASSPPGSPSSSRRCWREGVEPGAAERRAMLVLSAIEGALLLSRARRDTGPLQAVRDELVPILSSSRAERAVAGSAPSRRSERKEPEVPPRGVKKGSKRDKQYERIKESEKKQGRSTKRAEEIAARTVNKERARSGESKSSSRSSTRGSSASSRGGKRSGRDGPRGRTREQLYNEAEEAGRRRPLAHEQEPAAAGGRREKALTRANRRRRGGVGRRRGRYVGARNGRARVRARRRGCGDRLARPLNRSLAGAGDPGGGHPATGHMCARHRHRFEAPTPRPGRQTRHRAVPRSSDACRGCARRVQGSYDRDAAAAGVGGG